MPPPTAPAAPPTRATRARSSTRRARRGRFPAWCAPPSKYHQKSRQCSAHPGYPLSRRAANQAAARNSVFFLNPVLITTTRRHPLRLLQIASFRRPLPSSRSHRIPPLLQIALNNTTSSTGRTALHISPGTSDWGEALTSPLSPVRSSGSLRAVHRQSDAQSDGPFFGFLQDGHQVVGVRAEGSRFSNSHVFRSRDPIRSVECGATIVTYASPGSAASTTSFASGRDSLVSSLFPQNESVPAIWKNVGVVGGLGFRGLSGVSVRLAVWPTSSSDQHHLHVLVSVEVLLERHAQSYPNN